MISFSGIVKLGISGAFVAAGYAVAVHPVTLVALGFLPWGVDRLRQCCSRQQEPEIRVPVRLAAPAAAAAPAQAVVQGNQGLVFDAELAEAIRRSQNEAAQVHRCPYAKAPYALQGISTAAAVIPDELLYQKADGTKCNLARYLATLLFQKNAPGPDSKDFLGAFVDTNELRDMSEMLGFTLAEYTGIWEKAREQASHNGSPGYISELKLRFQIVREMLESNKANNIACKAAIEYLPE